MPETYVPTPKERELISKIQARFNECSGPHQAFVRHYEKNERAYHGILERASEAAKWKHQLHPPYAFNLIETIVSNTVEQGLRLSVRPSPHVNIPIEDAIKQLEQGEAVEDLLRHEHRVDEMDWKQRPLFLTAAIGGRGVGACYWNYTERSVRKQGIQEREIRGPQDELLGTVPTVVDIVEDGVARDHSTFEVLDPRDFITHPGAKNLQPFEPGGSQYLFNRCYYSFEQLKMMERANFVKNVDFLKEASNYSGDQAARGTSVFTEPHKDQIEVWEYWCMEDGEVHRVMVSSTGVILRDASLAGGEKGDHERSPFWHGQYPFVICASMPQPFTTFGKSDVELIAQLQEMLWETSNQRFDNIELINNFITLIRDDVQDPEAYERFPGANWIVDDPKSIATLEPPYQLADVSLHTEAMLKGDLQNVTSAAPFASGAETATVDQKTATGASIVMNAAQARLIAKKWEQMRGIVQEGNMRIQNCQQFLDEPRLAHILGPDGSTRFREIDPLDIQGDWLAELNPENDSNMRQERRAEATQFVQVVAQFFAPMMAAGGQPLNLVEVFKWYAKKWDVIDAERFLSQRPEALGVAGATPAGGGPPGPGGAPQDAGQANLGITAPPGPGADMAGSPAMALQRALAMGGGAMNTPSTVGR